MVHVFDWVLTLLGGGFRMVCVFTWVPLTLLGAGFRWGVKSPQVQKMSWNSSK